MTLSLRLKVSLCFCVKLNIASGFKNSCVCDIFTIVKEKKEYKKKNVTKDPIRAMEISSCTDL